MVGVFRWECSGRIVPGLLSLTVSPLPGSHFPLFPADDDAFEPVETGPLTPGDGDTEGALPRHLEQPLPTTGASLADLEDSADSSSALLVPPDPPQSGSTPTAEVPPVGGCHSRGSLNTMV